MLLVVCQLGRDVIGYEDSQCHWCVSIRLLSQFNSCVLFSPSISRLYGDSIKLLTTIQWHQHI